MITASGIEGKKDKFYRILYRTPDGKLLRNTGFG